MVFDTIKAAVGRVIPRSRLANDDDATTPDQVIDYEEWGPASTPGLGARIKARIRTFAVFGLGAVALFGFVFIQARQFAMGFIGNTLVQVGIVLAGTFGLAFIMGARHQRSVITDSDWLVPMTGNGAVPMPGEYRTATDGTQVFLPFRGFDFLGFKSEHLQLRELGEGVARGHAKRGRDPEDPARIRLDDARVEQADTAYGNFIAADCDGFGYDSFGKHSDAYLMPPSQVSEENYKQLHDQLQIYNDHEIPMLEKQLEAVRQERDMLRGELKQGGNDAVDEFIERMARIQSIQQEQSDQMNANGTGEGEPTIQEFERAAKQNGNGGRN